MKIAIPKEVQPGEALRAAHFNALVRAMRALIPQQGPGMRISINPSGTTYESTSGSNTSSRPVDYPWKVTATTVGTGAEARPAVQVAFATINNVEPTISGMPLHGVESDTGVVYPALPVTSTGFINARCHWSVSGIGSYEQILAEIEIVHYPAEDGGPRTAPEDTYDTNYRTIAFVRVENGAITDIDPAVTCSLFCERYSVGTEFAQYHWSI